MAQVMVQLAADIAVSFSKDSGAAAPLRRVLEELGVTLEPVAPGIDDPHLARYFQATVGSDDEAAKVATKLNDVAGVTAAYMQPPMGLP